MYSHSQRRQVAFTFTFTFAFASMCICNCGYLAGESVPATLHRAREKEEWEQQGGVEAGEREGSGQSVSSVRPVMMGCFAQLRCSIIQAFSHLRSVIPMDIRFDASVEANGRGQLQIHTRTHTKHMQISYLSCSCSGSCSQGWGV